MKLSAREVDKLRLHAAGELAQKRLARGVRLNHAEAAALIASQVRRPATVQLALHTLRTNSVLKTKYPKAEILTKTELEFFYVKPFSPVLTI